MRKLTTTAALAVLLAAPSVWAQTSAYAADDEQWHFAIAPYFWGSGVEGMVSFLGLPEQPVEASFSDVLDNLDFGLLGHFEARKGRWGFGTDLVYLNLGASILADQPILGQLDLEADVRQFMGEGFVFYRFARGGDQDDNPALADVVLGGRYNSTSSQISGSESQGTERTLDWVDGLLGVRFRAPLGSSFAFTGRGDIAGFGSDLTWQVRGELWWSLAERWSLGAGYRYMDVDYDKDEDRERKLYQVQYGGPFMAVVYGW
jgi:hypothetical protein